MNDITRLIYVPVLHAQEDSGRAGSPSPGSRNTARGGGPAQAKSAVDEMWEGIAAKIEGLNLPWNQVRIYQDGVPVCGNEVELVTRLAASGCRSSLYILEMIKQGALLEGTEDLQLLLQEYDLLSHLLLKRAAANQPAANTQYQTRSRELLAQRDQYIFTRIRSTLQTGELPVVFMGVMHRLDKLLEQEFSVSYVIYRLPFRSVGAIYNA